MIAKHKGFHPHTSLACAEGVHSGCTGRSFDIPRDHRCPCKCHKPRLFKVTCGCGWKGRRRLENSTKRPCRACGRFSVYLG